MPTEDCATCDALLTQWPTEPVLTTHCRIHASSAYLRDTENDLTVVLRSTVGQPVDRLLLLAEAGTSPHWATQVLHPDSGFDLHEHVSEGPDRLAQAARRAIDWTFEEFTAAEADAWEAAGFTNPSAATFWRGFGPAEAAAWRQAVGDPSRADGWEHAGFAPDTVPAGFETAPEWRFAHRVTGEATPDPRWALRPAEGQERPSVAFARAGFSAGKDPEAVAALSGEILRGGTRADLLTALHVPGIRGCDWADLAACVRIGMSVREAVTFVGGDPDMEAVRVLAALTG